MNCKLIRWFDSHVGGCSHMTATGLGRYLGQRWRDTVGYSDVGWGPTKCDGGPGACSTCSESLA